MAGYRPLLTALEKEIRSLIRHLEVRAELDNKGMEWRFNIARAPRWGGFFERMIKSVKQCLKKLIGNARLSFDEMLTILVEVEGTLNSRPLTYDDDNPSEEVLTPSHLIHGRRIHSLPEVLQSEEEFGENSAIYTRTHKNGSRPRLSPLLPRSLPQGNSKKISDQSP